MKKKFNSIYIFSPLILSGFFLSSCSTLDSASKNGNLLINNSDYNIYSSNNNYGSYYRFINTKTTSYIKGIKKVSTLRRQIGLSYNWNNLSVYHFKNLIKDVDFQSTSHKDNNKKLYNASINLELINDKDYYLTAYCNEVLDFIYTSGTYVRVNVVPYTNIQNQENRKPWYVFIFTSCDMYPKTYLKNDNPTFY